MGVASLGSDEAPPRHARIRTRARLGPSLMFSLAHGGAQRTNMPPSAQILPHNLLGRIILEADHRVVGSRAD